MLLLNPGPVTLSERVRRSLLQPDVCHRMTWIRRSGRPCS
jgi:aspartate aminotransferase-like enzyme